ncbi:glutathione metabolism protein [Hydrogenophaga crassostreae]|uniref:Glutathione metabolism protein n=1 Tax=Hydrogenophaga crassostreae TaxID=1763535 RepID=A0A162W0T5_9BURK|nr:MAPEG family protein [Hydrogenophaga crassostreae]AOW13109.1 glutathione metabolism protein [Hydrogenophaga crassostreae]OAD42745.1 glutathione metabolism protein [Hydrogenophaga crassostreae]
MIVSTGLTLAYWCVFVASMLPIVCAGLAKWGMFGKARRDGGYDNHLPRTWLASQKDWRARANAAQANSFEALPFFIGAVIIAHQMNALQVRVDLLALAFVLLRMVYILLYVANQASARSVVWAMALAANIALLFV